MKSSRAFALAAGFIPAAVIVILAAFAGCGNGNAPVDVLDDAAVLDSNQPDVIAGDTSHDTTGRDTTADQVQPDAGDDSVIADAVGDTLSDTAIPDAEADTGTPDECQFNQECDNCQLCLDDGDGKKCTTVLWEQPECFDDGDCLTAGDVCRYIITGRPECGGSCSAGAVFTLHEWGVNTVTTGGDGTMQAGPVKYYEAMDRKPVIYIYSDEQFTLDLTIEYNKGVTVETWPEIPASPWVVWQGLEVGTTECTTTPTPQPDYTGESPAQEVWELPSWVVADANCLTFGDTISKLLFYAGPFSNYEPGVDASLTGVNTPDGFVSVTNTLADAIGPVLVLYRDAESACQAFGACPVHTATIGWAVIDLIPAGAMVTGGIDWGYLHVDATVDDPYPSVVPTLPAGWNALPETLRAALIAKGLTADEATAFMTAWTDTMFGLHGADADPWFPAYDQGAFVIYLWPDSRTAQKLPLSAVPAPAQTVRAMVEYQQIPTLELL